MSAHATHILFVGTWLPTPGFGSPGPVFQHLKRLKSGNISLVSDRWTKQKRYDIPKTWRVINIPERGFRWPHIRYQIPGLFFKRLAHFASECERMLGSDRPSIIINHFGTNSGLAYHLSQIWDVPLFVFLYDPWSIWVRQWVERYHMLRGFASTILNHAAGILSVSRELADFFNVRNQEKVSIIPPIPEENTEGFAVWKDDFRKFPVATYAGSFHLHEVQYFGIIAKALNRLNGKLLLITTNNTIVKLLLRKHRNIVFHAPFDRTEDLFGFLRENASCIFVPLSFEKDSWRKIIFPSKFAQFSHLGLPLLIAAPKDTVIGRWSDTHNWRGYTDTLDDKSIMRLLCDVTDKQRWMDMAEQSRNAARDEFNPGLIQAQFESRLGVKTE